MISCIITKNQNGQSAPGSRFFTVEMAAKLMKMVTNPFPGTHKTRIRLYGRWASQKERVVFLYLYFYFTCFFSHHLHLIYLMLKKFIRFLGFGPQRIEDLVAYPEGKRFYREFHNLRKEQMDQDALKVINRLNRHGFRSYLVGGCVRDMLLGKKPKDFDVVTNATPSQVRKIFTNSRTIGRRFKIVHILFRGGKIIEVSTFRSLPDHRLTRERKSDADYMLRRDNQYGTPIEDAARRDFTINALFFDPRNESIIDYVGGFEDIKAKKITVIGDPDISFQEDPVRMLRAAKFAALIDFEMDQACIKAIRKNRDEITKASTSRMLEEYLKIFRTGRASEIFESFAETGLFRTLFPEESEGSDRRGEKVENFYASTIGRRLQIADKMLHEREELTSNIFFALIFLDLVHDIYHGRVQGNIANFVKNAIDPVCKRLSLPGKDRDRLLQVFISQTRFEAGIKGRKNRPDIFRKKVFFYESFMVYKINAIAESDDEAVQQAMFWEIGPRPRPPETNKIISVFPIRKSGGGERRKVGHTGHTSHSGPRSSSSRKGTTRRSGGHRNRSSEEAVVDGVGTE